jgi:hypothetical protein
MAAQTYGNFSGSWVAVSQPSVNISGSWTSLREIYVNDLGTWRLVQSNPTYSITSGTVTATGYGTSFYQLSSDGSRSSLDSEGAGLKWLDYGTTASLHEVFATQNSQSGAGGSVFTGVTGVWLNLGSSRFWSADRASAAGPGSDIWNLTLTVRRTTDLATVLTATINIVSSN